MGWVREHGYSDEELEVAQQLIAARMQDDPLESQEVHADALLEALRTARAYLISEREAFETETKADADVSPSTRIRALSVILRNMTDALIYRKRPPK